MKRNPKGYLADMYASMEKIEKYIFGLDAAAFASQDLVIDAVIRNLEIIGEAARNIPQELKDQHSDIAWKSMTALRNLAIHEYFGIDTSILWTIITRDLPGTKQQIHVMLDDVSLL